MLTKPDLRDRRFPLLSCDFEAAIELATPYPSQLMTAECAISTAADAAEAVLGV